MKSLLNHKFIGNIKEPGDKSITHRALMMAALAEGTSTIKSPLESDDTFRTSEIMSQRGVSITNDAGRMTVTSPGAEDCRTPVHALYTGSSVRSTRLLMGLLSGRGISATMRGDSSIAIRPMARVSGPLAEMGAAISLKDGRSPPIKIKPSALNAIEYKM